MMNKPTLNALFVHHVVLQANKPIRFFGTGEGEISVTIAGQTATAVCADGNWLAELPPMPYGGPYTAIVSLAGETTVLTDVWIGEVFIIAGQSNLQFKLSTSTTPREYWRDIPRLRLFSSPVWRRASPLNRRTVGCSVPKKTPATGQPWAI